MDDKNLNNLPDLNHLLHQHSILKSFNVNRRVTKSEISKVANSVGLNVDNMTFEDVNLIIATISNLEYFCGDIPGTKNSTIQSMKQLQKNYKKFGNLITYSFCVLDLLNDENLSNDEKLFILNKCIFDIQSSN